MMRNRVVGELTDIFVHPLLVQVEGCPRPKDAEGAVAQWRNILRGAHSRIRLQGEAFILKGCYPNRPPSHIVPLLVSVHTVFRRERDGAFFGGPWHKGQNTLYGRSDDVFTDESQLLRPVLSIIAEKRDHTKESPYDIRIAL